MIFFCFFVCGEVAQFFSVERLSDFSHSLTEVAGFIFLEVVLFVLQRGCRIFLLRDCVIFCAKRLRDFLCE